MADALYSDTSTPVSLLVAKIDRGEIALPDIQRPYLWSTARVRDLLDSMYRGFPVGNLLLWKTGVEAGTRQIGDGAKQSVPDSVIVDGQQRLTSLYAVMTGTRVVGTDYRPARIRIAFRPEDGTFAVADAATDKDPEYIPDISALWDPAVGLRPTLRVFFERLAGKREVEQTDEDRLADAVDRLRGLESYSFHTVELSATVDAEQVAEIFVRINSEGVTLNQADFILTLMSVFWESGRRELEEFCRDARLRVPGSGPSPFNWFVQPQPHQLLRTTVAVATRRARLQQVYAVLRGRDPESGKVSVAVREEQFAKLQAAQKHVLDLLNWHEYLQCLERAGFRGEKMLSGANTVFYTYALWLLGRTEYGVPLDRLRETVARWFFMAHTTARYSGSFESTAEEDFARLRDVESGDADGFVATLDKVVADVFTGDYWAITLPNDLASSAAKSPALLAYIAALNIMDADALLSRVKVRSRLDPAVLATKGIERHHLFPRQYLAKKLGVKDARSINQIANMALVDWVDNIKISDRAPAEYWPTETAAKPYLDADLLNRHTYWHALPDDWTSLPYDDFLAKRRVLMAAVVRDAFAKLGDRGYQPVYPMPEAPAGAAPSSRRRSFSGVGMRTLIDAELLPVGTTLMPAWGADGVTATVEADGRIRLPDDWICDSPSGAAKDVLGPGASANGWEFWIADTPSGQYTLAQLRDIHLGELEE